MGLLFTDNSENTVADYRLSGRIKRSLRETRVSLKETTLPNYYKPGYQSQGSGQVRGDLENAC